MNNSLGTWTPMEWFIMGTMVLITVVSLIDYMKRRGQ